jgi:hypothetical protein
MRVGFQRIVCAIAGIIVGLGAPGRSVAEDGVGMPASPPWRETWGGADVMDHAWSVYLGQSFSLSDGIQSDGWRLRAVSGYGQHRYVVDRWDGAAIVPVRHTGVTSFADILIGYQKGLGPLTIKALAGLHLDSHSVSPADPDLDLAGSVVGAKLVLESWINITDAGWASLDLSWTTGRDTGSARLRSGWRVLPHLSIGIEGHAHGDIALQALRAGAFLRYEWATGEASISGGGAETHGENFRRDDGLYGTVNVLIRY